MAGEWSLVAFTIIGQAAVGVYIFVGTPLFLSSEFAGAGADGGIRLAFAIAVLGLMAAAAGLSFFHLRHPLRAYRALSNLGRSWLSREVFFEIAFMGVTGVLGFCEWRRLGGVALVRTLFVLGGLAGVLFLLAMSRLYMLPAVPAWKHFYTPLSFFLTAVVLGAVAAAGFFCLSPGRPSVFRALLAFSLPSAAACFAIALFLAPGRGYFGVRPKASLRPPSRGPSPLHAARLSLVLAGSAVLGLLLSVREGPHISAAARPALLLVAFLLVACGEVSERFLFYGLSGRPCDGVGPQ